MHFLRRWASLHDQYLVVHAQYLLVLDVTISLIIRIILLQALMKFSILGI